MTSRPNTALRAARAAANLSQQAVADKLGVSKQSVSDWECGRNNPTPRTAIALTQLLPVLTIEDVFASEPPCPRRILDADALSGRRVSIPHIWAAP